jgi:hypothetical protein
VVGVELGQAKVIDGMPFYVIWDSRWHQVLGIHHCQWRTLTDIWLGHNPILQVQDCKKFWDLQGAAAYFRRRRASSRHAEMEPLVFCHGR